MNIPSLKALATKNETLVAVVIVAFCILATFSDPLFLSVTTLTDLMRASVVIGILAVAAMMVLISGGIDVSFTAIAVFAMYSTTVFTLAVMPDMPWYFIFAISIGIGVWCDQRVFCGYLPSADLDCHDWEPLSVFRGFLLTFIGRSVFPLCHRKCAGFQG